MIGIDNTEAWKQIPPEEKVELMARAHSNGFLSALITIIVCSTIAASLKMSFIMWGAIILSPLIFQFAAGKAWRGLRPRIMLEYLAARSAARRFAFAEGAKDLSLNLIFRGNLNRTFEREDIERALEAAVSNNKQSEVWIAVFRDTLVMLKEDAGGASLALGHPLNERLTLESSDKGGYSNQKEIKLISKDRMGNTQTFKVTSKYPGALAVFEKRVQQLQNENRKALEKMASAVSASAVLEDDDSFSSVGSF